MCFHLTGTQQNVRFPAEGTRRSVSAQIFALQQGDGLGTHWRVSSAHCFWLIPGESLWAPCASLPLPGVGGRLHGDGSARHLLHLLVAQLRGQGCTGGCVSREVRACFSKEQFLACGSTSSLAPAARTLLVLFLPIERQICCCTRLHRNQSLPFQLCLGVCYPSEMKESFLSPQGFGWEA